MSTIIMAACWPLQGMTLAQKAVLISLADQANDDGCCWPSVGTVARRCCMSERAVQSAMDWLVSAGILVRARRFNSSSTYTITPASFAPQQAPAKGRRKVAKTGDEAGAPPARGAPPPAPDSPPGAPAAPPTAPRARPGVRPVPTNRQGTIKEPPLIPAPASPAPGRRPVREAAPLEEDAIQGACRAIWAAFACAYQDRYGVQPVRNARVNSQVRQLHHRLGTEAVPVAEFFVGINEAFLLRKSHDLGVLLASAEAYRTQWATGRAMTTTQAQNIDRTQTNLTGVDDGMAILDRMGAFDDHGT